MYYEQEKEALLQKQIIPQTKQADFKKFWQQQVEALRQTAGGFSLYRYDFLFKNPAWADLAAREAAALAALS